MPIACTSRSDAGPDYLRRSRRGAEGHDRQPCKTGCAQRTERWMKEAPPGAHTSRLLICKKLVHRVLSLDFLVATATPVAWKGTNFQLTPLSTFYANVLACMPPAPGRTVARAEIMVVSAQRRRNRRLVLVPCRTRFSIWTVGSRRVGTVLGPAWIGSPRIRRRR